MINKHYPLSRIITLLICLSLFLASCSLPFSSDDLFSKTRFREPFVPTPYPPYFIPGECRFPVPPGEVRCGDLYVAEDRSDSLSRVITLQVAIFPSYSANPEPDPVIYLVGGGGADALGSAEFFLGTAGTMIRTNRDFILYNQRGVKGNDPYLACPGEAQFETMLNRVVHSEGEDPGPAYDFLMDCRDHLQDQGINLDMYDSLANAADLADLITALGYEKANLYGVSYGTRLGLTFMRYYPFKTRSAILDSVLPPHINFPRDGITSYLESLENLFAACASQEYCNQNYPNLEEDFYQAAKDLKADPIPLSISGEEVLLDHILFLDVIYLYLHEASLLPDIPQAIHNASQGEFNWIKEPVRAIRTYSDFVTTGVQYSSMCRDEVIFDNLENSQALLVDLQDIWQDYFRLNFYYQTCQDWVTEIPDPVENTPVASDLPALVLSGHFDSITAPSWNLDTASYLENSFYYEFPNLAHGVMRADSCALSIGWNFLDDPWTEPDASCLELLGYPEFD